MSDDYSVTNFPRLREQYRILKRLAEAVVDPDNAFGYTQSQALFHLEGWLRGDAVADQVTDVRRLEKGK